MALTDVLELLRSADDREITNRMLQRTPWIFGNDDIAYAHWKQKLIKTAGALSTAQIFLVGSASVGYSLSPLKPGREFRRGASPAERSDIDVAIVSDRVFSDAWDEIIYRDRNRQLGFTPDRREKIRSDIYSGHVTGATVDPGTGPSRLIRGALAATTVQQPFRGHPARARVYRREVDLIEYHVYSLRSLREKLQVAS
jgi:hypothetical protein